jgi:hypothetical protein
MGVELGGRRDVLGQWAGNWGGESAKSWMNVLAELKNRGVADVFLVVCDGLKGLPDSGNAVVPRALLQACVIRLLKATLRYASRKHGDQLAKDLKAMYSAPSVDEAWAAFAELKEKGEQVPPRDPQAVAGGVGGVHPVPGARRRDPASAVLHQRDRELERPLPPGRQGAGPLPHRAGRLEVPVPCHPRAGSQRHRVGTMDHAVEARAERFRCHFRRRMPAAENL